MQILIGASDTNLFSQSRDWILKNEFQEIVTDLESWVRSKEAKWGDCRIFIEVMLPPPESFKGVHGQIDMLISFTHRAAVCELKGHGFERDVDIDECKRQMEGQVKWITDLAHRAGYAPWITSLLFLYRLPTEDVLKVKQRLLINKQTERVWCAGARRTLKGKKVDEQPLYLPQALEAILSMCPPHITGLPFKIQQFLAEGLTKFGTKFHRFKNFDEARTWLKVVSPHLKLHPNEWFIAGLRREELQRAAETLKASNVLEIVGAPGIGKTTFVKELITYGVLEVQELNLRDCITVQDICNRIHTALYGDVLQGLGDEAYTQRLLGQPFLFWISNYNECSVTGLNDFFGMVRSVLAQGEYSSRWIIESRRPLRNLQRDSHALAPLNNRSISRILEKIEPGGAFHDTEVVVDKSEGNPGRAIRLWQSQNEPQAQAKDDIAWIVQQLTQKEKSLLSVLCMVAAESPLGVTVSTLVQLATRFSDDLPTDVKSSIESLLSKLETAQLADVTRFHNNTFGELLDKVVPDIKPLTVVNRLAPELIASPLVTLSDEERHSLRNELEEILFNTDNTDSLGCVTLMINLGDLEPFFRSSFRYTSLGVVIQYLDHSNWKATNERQKYLRKALQILWKINRNWTADARSELGEPHKEDPVQRFAYDFVLAREMTVRPLPTCFVLSDYLGEVAACGDADLQAAMYMSVTTALRNSSRYEEVWAILCDLPEKFAPNTTAWGLAIYQTVEFLNATKARKDVIEDEEAYRIIQRLALKLIERGLKTENIQSVCDGLFNYVRSQEMRKARTSFADVLGYLSAMRFIENAPGTRARQRLKILLTQGSIHRHYCRQSHLQWDEFLQHFDDGMDHYTRAIRSASAHEHAMHMLNSASYMMSFCVTSLRFRETEDARDVIAGRCKEVLLRVDNVEKIIANSKLLDGDRIILSSVKQKYPILLYVAIVSGLESDERRPDLSNRFAAMVNDVSEKLKAGRAPWSKQREEVRAVLIAVFRALDYARLRDHKLNLDLIELLRYSLLKLLKKTKGVTEAGMPLKEWRRLYNLCRTLVGRTNEGSPSTSKE